MSGLYYSDIPLAAAWLPAVGLRTVGGVSPADSAGGMIMIRVRVIMMMGPGCSKCTSHWQRAEVAIRFPTAGRDRTHVVLLPSFPILRAGTQSPTPATRKERKFRETDPEVTLL